MTGGLLDFFTLEATEYVDQLDALATHASAGPPDPDSFSRAARALRGSATMAKLSGIAEVAGGIERIARQVREGHLPWDTMTRGVTIAAIDDLKILVRGARGWGAVEESRAGIRIQELEQIAPRSVKTKTRGRGSEFLSATAAAAAAGLLEYAEQPGSREAFAEIMKQVRALRGIAALRDLPPLAEVVDAVDAAAKPIEIGQDTATAERRRLFRAAARVLLEGGDALRHGAVPPTESVVVQEFAHAAETLRANERDTDDVVPIASLLADPTDAAVQPAANPPTTAAQRFRLEVVSQAEHLRRLVDDGRSARDTASRERVGRELRAAVRTIARAAQSFAAQDIANVFVAAERGAAALEHPALEVLADAAALLALPESTPSLAPRFQLLSKRLAATPSHIDVQRVAPAVVVSPVAAPAAAAASAAAPLVAPTRPAAIRTSGTAAAPSGAALHALLATGIAGLAPLDADHLAPPFAHADDDVVPIDDLLFRGRDALQRAIEIGGDLRGSGRIPDHDTLNELYDLLQLAAAD